LTKETFKKRLELIKTQFDLMEKNHSILIKQNPFVEDGWGVPPDWLVQPYLDHLKTLFAAVNEDALYKTLLSENAVGFGVASGNQDKYVLTDLADYYVCEGNWGGSISVDGKEYHLKNPDELYEYLKTL
jgi:hypothetical protein